MPTNRPPPPPPTHRPRPLGRLPDLTDARRHLESYLDERLWQDDGSSGGVTSLLGAAAPPERVNRLVMTPRDIAKYVTTRLCIAQLFACVLFFLLAVHDWF